MDQNLLTIFGGIITLACSIVSYFISVSAKKNSNVKNIDALAKLANQGVAWVEKNYATNPEKLGAAIEYVTKGAKELKLKATPHQIEAQIEASLANLQRDPVGTVKQAKEATNEVFDNAEKVAELVAPIINGTEGM